MTLNINGCKVWLIKILSEWKVWRQLEMFNSDCYMNLNDGPLCSKHYIGEYYTYIYSYIYIHNQQFKSRIKQKIFHWCCQKNWMWKAPKSNCWRPFCFSLSKNSPLNPYFLCEVERPVYSVWPFCLELYNQVFWTFEKCYMTKNITFFGNFRIIKISQRILSDISSFLRNQLKLPKKCN